MKSFNLKLKIPHLKFGNFLKNPGYYWGQFLIVYLVFMLAVLLFDGWVFWEFSIREDVSPGAGGQQGELFNKNDFNKVSTELKEREEAYKKIRLSEPIEDPSLVK